MNKMILSDAVFLMNSEMETVTEGAMTGCSSCCDKPKKLFYLVQSQIPKDIPCAECENFSVCRKYKHICWRDMILAYGFDKWYYPGISCPKVPIIRRDISID